jgi:hypothetical protein
VLEPIDFNQEWEELMVNPSVNLPELILDKFYSLSELKNNLFLLLLKLFIKPDTSSLEDKRFKHYNKVIGLCFLILGIHLSS